MIKLDDQLLSGLSLADLPPEHRDMLLQAMHAELEARVGAVLAQHLTRRQLADFEAYVKSRDEAGALAWLERSCPRYRDVVAAQSEQLGTELAASRADVVALSVLYHAQATPGR